MRLPIFLGVVLTLTGGIRATSSSSSSGGTLSSTFVGSGKSLGVRGSGKVGVAPSLAAAASQQINSFQAYVEPRGDGFGGGGGGYGGGGGGGYGGSGGGWGGGGGSGATYHYAIQPHGGGGGGWQPPPIYYHEEDGGLEKGLIGLLGLSGLKGLLGLLGLAKLLLPLLALLFLPLLLPLLLAKALLLFALLLLIPVPVIVPATGKRGTDGSIVGDGKAFLPDADTLTDLLSRIPDNLNSIVGKIKDSEWFKGTLNNLFEKKKRGGKKSLKDFSSKESKENVAKSQMSNVVPS